MLCNSSGGTAQTTGILIHKKRVVSQNDNCPKIYIISLRPSSCKFNNNYVYPLKIFSLACIQLRGSNFLPWSYRCRPLDEFSCGFCDSLQHRPRALFLCLSFNLLRTIYQMVKSKKIFSVNLGQYNPIQTIIDNNNLISEIKYWETLATST